MAMKYLLLGLCCIQACIAASLPSGLDMSRCVGIACASVTFDPICGSDGVTYMDSCDFILRTCATNPPVTRAHKGTCDGGPGGIFG